MRRKKSSIPVWMVVLGVAGVAVGGVAAGAAVTVLVLRGGRGAAQAAAAAPPPAASTGPGRLDPVRPTPAAPTQPAQPKPAGPTPEREGVEWSYLDLLQALRQKGISLTSKEYGHGEITVLLGIPHPTIPRYYGEPCLDCTEDGTKLRVEIQQRPSARQAADEVARVVAGGRMPAGRAFHWGRFTFAVTQGNEPLLARIKAALAPAR